MICYDFVVKGVGKNQISKIAKEYSQVTFKSFQKQLKRDGIEAILRSRASIEKNLKEHLHELEGIKNAGGYTSSVEREIRTYKSQLKAIDDLIK